MRYFCAAHYLGYGGVVDVACPHFLRVVAMLTAQAEAELRAIKELARGCHKATNSTLFSALADRLDSFLEDHGEAAWRRRVGQLPIAAGQHGATWRVYP